MKPAPSDAEGIRAFRKPTLGRNPIPPLPPDAVYLSIEDVAAYLRTSKVAIRKALDGRPDRREDRLGDLLRQWIVQPTPHRRFILREPFMRWYRSHAGQDAVRPATGALAAS